VILIYRSDIPSRYIEESEERQTMLELAILGLLKERPMHGYQLSRELSAQLGGLWKVSYGSLYPTLRRLERDGAVEQVPGTQAGATRKRLVYRITPDGEELFIRLLEEPPSDTQAEDTRFRVRLAFFRYLPPETRIRLLDRRRAALDDRLAAIKDAIAAAADTDDDYHRALMEHGRAATEADIAWLTGLIQHERNTYGITAPVGQRRRASATLRRKEHTA
jgi:DNA-binding PadR family transcriptional regulator